MFKSNWLLTTTAQQLSVRMPQPTTSTQTVSSAAVWMSMLLASSMEKRAVHTTTGNAHPHVQMETPTVQENVETLLAQKVSQARLVGTTADSTLETRMVTTQWTAMLHTTLHHSTLV